VLYKACFISFAALVGCAGTVIVDFSVDAQVSTRAQDASAWSTAPGQIIRVERPARLASPFDALKYRSNAFEWTFATGTLGLGGRITNLSPAELCFRFDEATIASNFHATPMTFTVRHFHRVTDRKWDIQGSTKPGEASYFVPPRICLAPNKTAELTLSPDLKELFPSGRMFDVQWDDDEPRLTRSGVGNWVQVSVPIDQNGTRQQFMVKLSAADSRARVSHY
jgi:hypothetical protein